jgi:hypothetical protein
MKRAFGWDLIEAREGDLELQEDDAGEVHATDSLAVPPVPVRDTSDRSGIVAKW